MSQFYAYLHCKPDGTPFYVGKGTLARSKNLRRRNKHHQSTVAKYGAENILIGRLECSSEDIAFDLERGLIKCLRRGGTQLTNMTDGGEGVSGHVATPETRAKQSAALKNKKRSAEARAKLRGNTNGSGNKGNRQMPGHRAARARAMVGNTNGSGNKGRRLSPEHRDSIRAGRVAYTRPVWVGGVLYPSLTIAASALGAARSSISGAIQRGRPCKGMEVRYGD